MATQTNSADGNETDECDALATVADVTFRYPGADEPTLVGADLSVRDGEFLAVVGGNGSGKTTLCKTLTGIVPHFYEPDHSGTVTVCGSDTRNASVAELSRDVGYVFQDFANQLVQSTVVRDVSFGPLNHGDADHRARALEVLELLGIDHLSDRFVWELSGGQQHLVALASALATDPEILVVDEPAAQLDPHHASDVYERLRRLNDRHGKTVVAIEHRTEFVAEHADRVALVADGAVEWTRPTSAALSRLDDLRARDVEPPQVTRVAARLGRTDEDGHYPTTVREGAATFAGLTDAADGDADSVGTERSVDDPLVTFDGVTHSYPTLREGRERVLDDLSVAFGRGERVALVGPNGAGKSTLLRLVTGLERPSSGTVSVDGVDTSEALPERLADSVVYVNQNPEEMFIADSVRDEVAYFLEQRGHDDADERAEAALASFDLTHLADRDARLLSVGQQRRVSLAVGVAMDPTVVLLDEPTGSLDPATRADVGGMLDRAGARVETTIVATHDLQLVAEWADRVVLLDDGRVRADATPRDLFSRPALLDSVNLRVPQAVELSDELGLTDPALDVAELADRLGGETGSAGATDADGGPR